MPSIDWALLADRGGESIEDFIATLLRRKYRDALQVNPSQGDKGIDVYRDTDEGLVVWQVKKFTSPLVASQWRQVQKSWNRFVRSRVNEGVKIASYNLVTPWTPTQERREQFARLTSGVSFPTQWDGDAFIAGLIDEFPDSLARFVRGPNVLDSFLNEKALLASSPIEVSGDIRMMEAIETRQRALNEIRDLVSDEYVIDAGTRTYANDTECPLPYGDEAGVMHRYEYLGNNRFAYQSVVPRNSQSIEKDPITLEVEFLAEPGTSAARQIKEWKDWGVPFTDLPSLVRQTGGPFGDAKITESLLSYREVPSSAERQRVVMRVGPVGGSESNELVLTSKETTRGFATDRIRIVASSPNNTFTVEVRLGMSKAPSSAEFRLGDIEGMSATNVLADLAIFDRSPDRYGIVFELERGPALLRGDNFEAPAAFGYLRRLATALKQLQPHCTQDLKMPGADTTVSQLALLERIADLYVNSPHSEPWESMSFTAKSDNSSLVEVVESGRLMIELVVPEIELGNRKYVIDHPLLVNRGPVDFVDDISSGMKEGQQYSVRPRSNQELSITPIADWKPGDPPIV